MYSDVDYGAHAALRLGVDESVRVIGSTKMETQGIVFLRRVLGAHWETTRSIDTEE